MTNVDPAWSLTDDALALILHAENDISRKGSGAGLPSVRMRDGRIGGPVTEELWLREIAVLRLVTTIEGYANSACGHFKIGGTAAPFSWPPRKKHYRDEHSIDLELLDGWQLVDAGIDLRNCVAHGLGNITEKQLGDLKLGVKARSIDVSIAGGRLHSTGATVPLLANACRRFVLDLERAILAANSSP